jgi:hypothetical protein
VCVLVGYASRCFGHFLLISEESCHDPKVVPQHAPGDGEITVVEAAAAQTPALALAQGGNAGLGRTAAALQPGETLSQPSHGRVGRDASDCGGGGVRKNSAEVLS